jgi:hypothetical protein
MLILAAAVTQSATAQRSRHNNRFGDWDRGRVTDTAIWQWKGTVASGKTLRVRGIVGDIDAKPGRGPEAVVHAVKRAHRRADTSDVQIHVERSSDGITVCAVYPNQDAQPDECPDGSNNHRRHRSDDEDRGNVEVDFTVEVPAGVDFIAETVTGDVKADSMPANAEGHSVTGDVTLSARGHGSASSVTGDVFASLGGIDAREGGSFRTVTGDVVVTLPETLNADVTASTVNGDLVSDFPMTVQGRFMSQRMHGRIGSGGPQIELGTVTGDIKLRKR